jgi:hypothetical protein
MEGYL